MSRTGLYKALVSTNTNVSDEIKKIRDKNNKTYFGKRRGGKRQRR